MNNEMPAVPLDILPIERPDGFEDECVKLWEWILEELTDEQFITRSHHSTGTHDKGCRGPLCRKAYREHPRRKTPNGFSGYTPREERVYDPIIDYFHVVAKYRIKMFQRSLYQELA